jgi:hypothetical protein
MFRKLLDQGQAGDNVGCLLRGIEKDDIERGQVLAKPGSITPHTKFLGEVYVLKKEEGGRHTPFFTNYRPQFYIRTTDVTGTCKLPEDVKMVMPGDNITMDIELIAPVALEEQMRFAIREGGKTVGAGVVTKTEWDGPAPGGGVVGTGRHEDGEIMATRLKVVLACEQCARRNFKAHSEPAQAGAEGEEVLSRVQRPHGAPRDALKVSLGRSQVRQVP